MQKKMEVRKQRDKATYVLETEVIDGITEYLAHFIDGQGVANEVKISEEIHRALEQLAKDERAQMRWIERHTEWLALAEEEIMRRAVREQKTTEEMIVSDELKESLKNAIADLPNAQRRRLVLYYYYGLTYEKISQIDNCKRQVAMRSVAKAVKNIRRQLCDDNSK
jgi:RNA polymerase sigma-70 factor (ECF subfamily)